MSIKLYAHAICDQKAEGKQCAREAVATVCPLCKGDFCEMHVVRAHYQGWAVNFCIQCIERAIPKFLDEIYPRSQKAYYARPSSVYDTVKGIVGKPEGES